MVMLCVYGWLSLMLLMPVSPTTREKQVKRRTHSLVDDDDDGGIRDDGGVRDDGGGGMEMLCNLHLVTIMLVMTIHITSNTSHKQ